MQIEFAGQSANDPDNQWANSARLLNCFREPVGDGNWVVKPVPGLTDIMDIGGGFCRAAHFLDGSVFFLQDGSLYEMVEVVGNDPTTTPITSIPDSLNSTISGNNGVVTIVADGRYFNYEPGSLSEPTGGAFTSFGDVTFYGQLTVLTELNGRRIQWSDPATPGTLDALNFATSETRDDNILRVMPVGASLWVFKETSIEIWQQNGAALAYIPGSTMEPGLKGRNLLADTQNGCFFIGTDNKAYLAAGGIRPVSNVAVETSIATEFPTHVAYYQDEGHEVCVISFNNRPAWCFDISTGEWHERPDFTPRASVLAFGNSYVGLDNVGLRRINIFVNTDGLGALLESQMIGRTIQNGGEWFTVSKMHINASSGVDGVSGTTAELSLAVSRDKGRTWGSEKVRGLGDTGDFDRQITWRALGRAKQFTPRFTWTEPRNITISSNAEVTLT